MFKPATIDQNKLRIALLGPTGSGKTYTALQMASVFGKRIALIDTERSSANWYSKKFKFDTVDLASWPGKFSAENYMRAINGAASAGYDCLIIDSLSHAWSGAGGILAYVDNQGRNASGGNFGAWRNATPLHNQLIDTMLAARLHLIVTMRVEMDHVQEKDSNGKTFIRKVGLQAVQRKGMDYEFDIVIDIDTDHVAKVSKSRCFEIADQVYIKPGDEPATTLLNWANSGAPVQVAAQDDQL